MLINRYNFKENEVIFLYGPVLKNNELIFHKNKVIIIKKENYYFVKIIENFGYSFFHNSEARLTDVLNTKYLYLTSSNNDSFINELEYEFYKQISNDKQFIKNISISTIKKYPELFII